ncbi:zinc-dependent metalloprotease family protein [Kitasatospora sp. NPDC094028]
MAPHFDVNVIVVAKDAFTPAELTRIDLSVGIMKTVFATFGPEVGTVRKYSIGSAKAGRFAIIRSRADARALTNLWWVNNDAIDLFVVRLITDPGFDGLSPIGAGCSKNRTKGHPMRAPVVSIQEGIPQSGNTFAHELGHFLGLRHCEDDPPSCAGTSNDFMFAASGPFTGITSAQAAKMKSHCAVKP